jgi:hypothetical protein
VVTGGGFGMFPTFNPPTNGSDYNDTTKMFQPSPVSKTASGSQRVEGYFTKLASQQVNPDTGLFNVDYVAPYYGAFYNKGGRVGKRMGGVRQMNPNPQTTNAMQTYYDLINSGHSPGSGCWLCRQHDD